MKNNILKIFKTAKGFLKVKCNGLSSEKRLMIVLIAFILFGTGAIWIFVNSIRDFNKSRETIRIEHIVKPDFNDFKKYLPEKLDND